ncbi:MAG: hypothetical protein AAF990_25655 [Bacteroidota bacterium]
MSAQTIFHPSNRSFENNQTIEATACPNCWGVQEWCDKYQPSTAVEQREGSFIKKFVDTYLPGIVA